MSRVFGHVVLMFVAVVLLAPASVFAASGEYRALVLSHNPAAYYPLDETSGSTASDISGNGLDGTYNSVVLGNTGALGSATTSVDFDGSSSYIQLPGTWGGGSALTVEAWIYVDNTSVSPQSIVASTGSDFVHFQAKDSGNLEFYVDAAQLQTMTAPAETPTGTWRHVVVVLSSGNSRLYIDGVQSASSAATFTSITSSGDVRIGMGPAPGRFFNGRIDEVAIYNTALTVAHIQSHFNAQPDGPITSIASGNWSSAGTWSNGLVPTSIDDVQINNSHTVTVDVASVTVNNLTVLGVLDLASFGMTVTNDLTVANTIDGIATLTLPGTAGSELNGLGTINAPVLFDTGSRSIPGGQSPTLTGTVFVDGSVTNGGDVTLSATTALSGTGNWTQGSTGTLEIEGAITLSTFNASAIGNTVRYTGSSQPVRDGSYYQLETAGIGEARYLAGAISIAANFSIEGELRDEGYQITGPGSSSGKTMTMDVSSLLQIGTSTGAQPNNGTTLPLFQNYILNAGSTISYEARANQTIESIPYANLAVAVSGLPSVNVTKSANGGIIVDEVLNVTNSSSFVVFDIGAFSVDVGGDLIGAGTINTSGGVVSVAGHNTSFTGTITPNYDITFNGTGSQSIRGTTYNGVTINKASGTAFLAGAATMAWLTISNGTFADSGFVLTGGVGNLFMNSNATFLIGASMPSWSSYALDPDSKIVYKSDGNQLVAVAVLYGNLYIETNNTNATKTLDSAGTLNVLGDLDISSSGTGTLLFDLSGNTADIDGDITGDGDLSISGGTLFIGGNISHTGAFNTTGAGVKYDGTGAQTVRGTAYQNLYIDKFSGTATLGGNTSVGNTLDVNSGTLNLATYTLGVGGTAEVDGTLEMATGVLDLAGDFNVNGTIDPGTTSAVQITGGSQQAWNGTAAAVTIKNLNITGAGGMALSSVAGYDLTVDGNITLGGGDLIIQTPRMLTQTTNGTTGRTSGEIRGKLAIQIPAGQMRRFETGNYSSSSYSPIEITSTNAATISVFAADAGATSRVGATWTIAGDPSTVDLKYYWENFNWGGDIRGFVPVFHDGSSYTFPAGYVDSTSLFAEVSGVGSYAGDWTAGYFQAFGGIGPSIASFTPTNGASGTSVQLFGSNFTTVTGVSFNGTPATSMSVVNDNEIGADVPAGATTGTISATDGTNTGTSFNSFTVSAPVTIQTAQAGNWTSTSTWQGGVVPNSWDNAIINHAVSVDANVSITDIEVNTSLAGPNVLTVQGTMTWNNGTISAPLMLLAAAIVDVDGGGSHVLDTSTQGSGTINLNADLTLTDGSSISNNGAINIAGDFDLVWDNTGSAPNIYNTGTITKTLGSGTSLLGGGADITNTDTITAAAGTLRITSAIVTAEPPGGRIGLHAAVPKYFTVANGATMEFSNGATFIDLTTFSGTGTILISSAVSLSGTINSTATNFVIDAPSATMTCTAATFAGNITAWKQGLFTGALTTTGTVTTASGASPRVFTNLTLVNNGTIALAGSYITITNGTTIDNNGTIDFQDDHSLDWDNVGSAPSITNDGTIKKTGGINFALLGSSGVILTNNSILRSQSATLRVQGNATIGGTVDAVNAGNTVEFPSSPSFTSGTTFTGSGLVLINSGATFNGSLTQTAATARIDTTSTVTWQNTATISGTMEWKDAVFTGPSLGIVGGSIIDTVAGSSNPVLDGIAVTNNGTVRLSGASLTLRNGASFDNQLIVDIQDNFDFKWAGTGAVGSISNSGTIKKTGGGGTSILGNTTAITNSNAIEVQTGTLQVSSPITNTGSFPVSSGATALFTGGATFNNGTVFSGLGTADINSNATFNGTIGVGAATTMIRGTANTMTFNSATVSGGTLTWKEAKITGTGLTVSAGDMLRVVSGGGTASLDAGTLTVDGDMELGADVPFHNGANFTLTSNGSLTFLDGYDLGYDGTGATPSMTLSGLLQKTLGTTIASVKCGSVCTNGASGKISVTSGTLAFPSGLTNNGTIEFPINGPTAVTDYGRIDVTGTVTLAGTATAVVDPSFDPDGGATFQVMTFTAKSGDFATKNYTFDGTRTLSDTYSASDLVLTASGPTITSVVPNTGGTTGGDNVTINGTGFVAPISVFFDGISATNITLVNATQITCDTPAHAAGAVDVLVSANGEPHTSTGAYTYSANAPVITTLSVTSGTINGGTYVEISGSNLATVTQVQFGGSNATILSATAGLLKVRTPSGTGTVSVSATSPDGTDTLATAFTYVTPVCYSPSATLAWFRGENDPNDSAGGTSGSNDGGYAAGKVGQGFSLDGTQHVSVANSIWNTPSDVTLEGWVKFDTVPVGNYAMLFGKTAGTGTFESYGVSYKDGLLYCGVGGPSGITYHTASFTPIAGAWYHVALTFDDASNDLRLYVDGQLALSATENAVIGYDAHALTIGTEYENESLAYFFDGTIDEVTLYPLQLGAADILAIYDADTAGKCFPAAPLVLSVSPVTGPTAGGTNVTIAGSSLGSGSATIGNTISGVSASQAQITGTTGATAAGTYNVDVITPAGTSSLVNGFTYVAPGTYTSITNGNWTDPATWGAASYPQSADTAVVNHDVTVDASVTVLNLTVNGTGTRLSGTSTLTVTGSFTWNGGDLFAPLTLDTGSTTSITGSAARTLGGTTVNNGTITFDATGAFTLHTNGITNNGTFNLQNDNGWQRVNAPTFTNAATANFNKTAGVGTANWAGTFTNNGTMTLSSGTLNFAEAFSNASNVSVTAGSLRLSGSGTSSGSFSAGSTASVEYFAGSHTFSGTLTGTGKLAISGGTVTITGTPSVTNMDVSGGTTTGAGTLTVATMLNWTGGNLGAAMIWSGTAQITGAAARTIGTDGATVNNGTVNHSATGTVTLQTNNFTNNGTYNLQSDGAWTNFNAPTFTNASGAFFNKTGGVGTSSWPGLTVVNAGTMSLSSGAMVFSGSFSNSNIVNVNTGTLFLTGSGSSSGTFATGAGTGVVDYSGGSHTFSGSFTGNGSMSFSGATVTINGAPSVTNLDVTGGTTNGTGTLTVVTTLDWSGGTLGAGMLWSGTTQITGTNALTLGVNGATTNSGTVHHFGTGTLTVHTNNFSNGGTYNLRSNAPWARFGSPTIVNTGNFYKFETAGTSVVDVAFDNSSGNVIADLGTINFAQAHTNNASSSYQIGVNSATSAGAITFASAQNISAAQFIAYPTGVFVPQGGQTWTVMSPTSGAFASTTTTFGTGRSFIVSYPGGNSVLLTASGPTIGSLTPNSGSEFGGTSVVIAGTGFTATPSVTFGGTSATSVTHDSATQLTVVTPAHAVGTVDVVVTNPDGQPTTLTNGFTFGTTPPPAISTLRPNTGNVAGGSTVFIDGTSLDTVSSVTFAGANATIVTQTATQLEVLAPASVSGPVTVTATNPAGSANQTFTYDSGWNAAREFSRTTNPTTGPWSYGKKSGATFTALTNSEAYGSMWGWNDGAGFVLPELVANFGTTNLNVSTWSLPPFELEMHPTNAGPKAAARWIAPSAGQWQIDATFTGIDSGFRDVSIEINNVVQFSSTVSGLANQSTTLNRTLNAGDTVDFIVGDGGNGNSNDATALDANITPLAGPVVTVTGISPAAGPTAGNQSVTITGTNFHAGAGVLIGGTAATGVVVATANQITAFTPAHAAGTVDVVVTHADSADATLSNGYTFADTTVSISKTAPANVAASTVFTYTITVNNSGANPAVNVSVSDVIQAGMVPSNIVAPSFSCSGTGTLTCTAATLTTGTHTITFDVTAPATPQAITNVANLSAANDTTSGDNSSSAVTNVGGADADLSVTTTGSSPTVAAGGSMTWTTAVTNNGPSPATGVVLTNTVPAGQTITGVVPGTCNVVGNVVTCNVGSLAVSASSNVVITVTANDGGTWTNNAGVDGTETDSNAANDTASANVTITGDSTLVVTTNAAAGIGSLAQAITDANTAGVCPAPCTISFAMPGSTVIAAALPTLTANNVTIDGTTQSGYVAGSPVVVLDGSAQSPGTHGLIITGTGNTVRGLSVNGYTDGIRVQGSGNAVTDNTVFGNTSGVTVVGGTGVRIRNNSIHSNAALPIDHDADGVVEILDAGDPDTGSNNLQNAPVISSVEITPSDLDVTLNVDSASVPATQSVYVEVFKTDGAGEPQTLLGGQCVPGNNLVNQLINVPTGTVAAGNGIVAIATSYTDGTCTNAGDGTSEVSASVAAGNCVPPAVTITGPTAVCAGGSVTLDAGLHQSYLWTPGNFTSQTISVSPGGTATYTVTVTDASGCSNTDTHTVTVNTPAAVNIAGPTTSCSGASVTLTATAGFAGYLWQPGNLTGQSITANPAADTTYTVTATDGNNCTSSDTHTVTVTTAAPVNVAGPTTSCSGASVTLTATAGFAGYLWQPGNLTGQSITVNPAADTTYTVTATDGSGCTSSDTHTVTVTTAAPVNIAGPTTSCPSASVTLTATAGFSGYLWQPGNLTGQSITVNPAADTTYTVTATDGNGCTSTDTHTVTVTTAAPVNIAGPTTSCSGASVTLTATAGFAGYLWQPGNLTGQSITVNPTADTTYTVTATDGSGCTSTDTHTVTVTTAAPVNIAGPTTSCSGASVTLTATAGFSGYLWQPGNLTGQSITVNPAADTAYTVTATAAGGCTANASHSVTVNTPAGATITPSGPTTFCSGGSVVLTATAGSAYLWSPGGETSQSITVTAGGTYGVAVTDINGCVSNAAPVTVTVNTAGPVSITGPATSCPSASVTLTATAGFTSYLWQPGNLTGQSITVTPAADTTYTVTATDGNGCTATNTHTVTVTTAPSVAITGPSATCSGSSVTLTATAGFTSYLWQPGNLTGQSITVSPTANTTYTVTATAAGGCTANASHAVTVNTPAAATATASGPTTFCAGGSVVLTGSAGETWQWLPGGETTQSITVTASGTYSVVVTDINGCTSTSNTVNVTVNPAPAVTITGPTATCTSTPVTLDAGPGASYLWTPGNFTTQTITVSPASTTTYTVTVTNAAGCTGTDAHTVTVTSNPTATVTAPAGICEGATGINAQVGVTPGATYTWTIANGLITQGQGTNAIQFQPTGTANVQLGVTVAAGSCTATGSATVQVYPQPATPVITAPASVGASTGGHGASIAPQAGASYSWSIEGGTINSAISGPSIVFSAGTTTPITLTVAVNINGCIVTATKQITVDNATEPPADEADLAISKSAPSTVTAGSTFSYTLTVTNAGPSSAISALVTDTLPAGVTLLSIDGGAWSCGPNASVVNCSMPAISAGTITTITITIRAPSQAGTIVNSASVSSAVTDPNSANDSDSVSTSVVLPSPSCPAVAPALLSPANGATGVTSPVTLTWSDVDGAASYDVWVATEGVLTLAGSTSSTSMTVSVGSGVTNWYIIAHGGSGCDSMRSSTFTFTVPPSSSCLNHAKPQITAPSGPVATSPMTIGWTPVPQAIGYRVWISVDGTALQDVGSTGGALNLTVNVPAGAITVFVDALFNGCPPTRSDGASFEVPQPDPCASRGAATLVAPSNNALINASAVELRWNAAPSLNGIAPQYRVWAAVDGEAPEVRGTTSETSLRTVFERGQVVWYVETLYPGCSSAESSRFNFTIPARNECGTARPALIAPANGVTLGSANVSFSWTGVANAVGYEIYLALGQETPALVGTVPAGATSFNYIVPAGNLTWFVRALIDRCPSRDSVEGRFTYDPPAACESNERPVAIAPLETPSAVASPVEFSWSRPDGATRFELYTQRGNEAPVLVASTNEAEANGVALAAGAYRWFVRAFFNGCSPLDSASQELLVAAPAAACAVFAPPVISAPGQISSGVEFLLQWTPAPAPLTYQLQIAGDSSFDGAEVVTTTATQHALVRINNGAAPLGVYARVRAIDGRCNPPAVTAYGPVSAIFVLPQQGSEGSAPLANETPVTYTLPIGAEFASQTFTATPNQPWLTVVPSSGVVGANGASLLVTAATGGLELGTNLGAISVTLTSPSSRITTNGTTTVTSTLSVNLVTPVTPAPKNTPPPDALIIPAVANADGINSHFQSDVRVSNTSPQLLKYQLTYTPTGETGLASGRQTTFSIEPGRTVALDDILKSWFGTGSASSTGTLEVRPLTPTSTSVSSAPITSLGGLANLVTFASSRTFNVTPNGTFGQHIPAIPFANFIGKPVNALKTNVLSLQQIAQSPKYRTNLGLVEGSGEAANLLIRVFGSTGAKLTEFPVALKGGQHTQMNAVLAQHQITDLTDGRIEVEVVSGNGKVTAYASVLDNQTSDPLLVSPVTLTDAGNTRWVVPGVADLNNGVANWQTDMRVFNAGTAEVSATLAFYSQNGGAPKTAAITIPAGQVRTFDKTLSTVFGAANDGGAVHITTSSDARLIATARTYNQTTGGTYGQFISAVTPPEAAGVGTRPLQLLQVEESDRFRSNIGLAEVTGNPVKLEISIIPPDGKFTAVAQLDLGPNEFRQIGSLLRTVGLSDTYNARVTVRAIEGTGRVAAYASVIDMLTNDPTYVPAQ